MDLFKYELPSDCPKILKEGGFQEGDYDIFYFRISQNCPMLDRDILPQLFLDEFHSRKESFEKEENFSKLCQMASLSVLQKETDAINFMKKYKKIGKYLYKGIVLKNNGLILVTPSGNCPTHCSFYSYTGTDERTIFCQKVF